RTDEKKPRLSIVLSQQNKARIDRVVEQMGADSITEATKDAFRLLEYFLKVADQKGQFYIKMPSDDAPKQLEIFGITDK
ncbi:hypothetical protein R3X27_25585, partial [Tropicimonas sp. TH_r6]|uniref:hypothetical protein n=1 Tax=Tropicimonas sp. TH_r6 TaxID=3082085 RepID=UPI002952D1C0